LSVLLTRKRMRSLTLRLKPSDERIHVSAPLRASLRSIRGFVLERRDWIARQRQRLAQRPAKPVPAYADGDSLRVLGQVLTLRQRPGRLARARIVGDELQLACPVTAALAQRETAIQRCLARHLLDSAQALLPSRVAALGVQRPTLRVRRMRSRWGSCKTREGVITLALALAWHEPATLDYILVHELAHLKERSHGPRFKAILDEHVPGWRALRRELNGVD
jgi:predicted metal-dependent hydrolase